MAALIAMLLLLVPSWASATTYYVATTGSNANTCGQAQNESTPKLTISAGVGCLAGGDTLILKAGTYTGQEITNPPAGSDAAYTVIMGDPSGARPLMLPNSANGQRGLYCNNGSACHHIEMRYIEVEQPWEYSKLYGTATIGYANHIRFIDNKFHDSKASGIIIESSLSGFDGGDHLFQGNEFYNTGIGTPNYRPGFNTIYNPGNRSIVERNVFHDGANGIGIWKATPPNDNPHAVQNVIIRNNIFYRMGRTDLNPWLSGATMYSGIHVSVTGGGHQIYNNIFYDSGNTSVFFGIRVNQKGTQAQRDASLPISIYNNTFYNIISASAPAVHVRTDRSEGGPHPIKNNIAYLAGAGLIGGVSGVLSNNQTTNPSFTNAGTGDFTLQGASTAINAGTGVGLLYCGSAPDIGAFETCGPISASAAGTTVEVIMATAAAPIQPAGTLGWSISTGTITNVSRKSGSDNIVALTLAASCSAGAKTVSYNASTGGMTDSANIGGTRSQKTFSFGPLSITDNCGGSPPAPPAGPAQYLMLDGDATDSSGNANHGTATGGSYVSAKYGSGFTTTNGATDRVNLNYGSGVDPSTTSFTIAFGVNVTEPSANRTYAGTELGVNQRLHVGTYNGTWGLGVQGSPLSTVSDLAVTSGWHMVVLLVDSATDTAKVCVDGVTATSGSGVKPYTSFILQGPISVGLPLTFYTAGTPTAIYDEVRRWTTIESCTEIWNSWEPPPVAGNTFSQTAVRAQHPYTTPDQVQIDLQQNNQPQRVVVGGAVAWNIQVECNACPDTGFRVAYRKNGTGAWKQVPAGENTDGIYMWGDKFSPLLNIGDPNVTLTGSCTRQVGATLLSIMQVPLISFPASGCVTMRVLVRIGNNAVPGQDYFELRLEKEGGIALNTYSQLARIDVIERQFAR